MKEFTDQELEQLEKIAASKLDLSNVVVAVKKLKSEVEVNFNVLLEESKKLSSKISEFDNEIKSIPLLKSNFTSIQDAQRRTETQVEKIKFALSENEKLINRLNNTLESESQKLKNAIDRQTNSERDISNLKLILQENLSIQKENKEQLDKCVSNLKQETQRINDVIQEQKQTDRKLFELENKFSSTVQKLTETKDAQDKHYEEFQRFTKETITRFNSIERQFETIANNLKEESLKANQRIDSTLTQLRQQDQTIKDMDAKNAQFHNALLVAQQKNAKLTKVILGLVIPITCVSIFLLISFLSQ